MRVASPFLSTRTLSAGTNFSGLSFVTHKDKPAAGLMHKSRFQQVDVKLRSYWVPITFPSPKGTIPALLASEKQDG